MIEVPDEKRKNC